jgi:hypothetical protein
MLSTVSAMGIFLSFFCCIRPAGNMQDTTDAKPLLCFPDTPGVAATSEEECLELPDTSTVGFLHVYI